MRNSYQASRVWLHSHATAGFGFGTGALLARAELAAHPFRRNRFLFDTAGFGFGTGALSLPEAECVLHSKAYGGYGYPADETHEDGFAAGLH